MLITIVIALPESHEYQTLLSCTSELICAVRSDLTGLSGRLRTEGLISANNCSELRNRNVEEADRAARLVELVQIKVELNSQNYFKFICVLERESRYYSDILRILHDKHHSIGNMTSFQLLQLNYNNNLLIRSF